MRYTWNVKSMLPSLMILAGLAAVSGRESVAATGEAKEEEPQAPFEQNFNQYFVAVQFPYPHLKMRLQLNGEPGPTPIGGDWSGLVTLYLQPGENELVAKWRWEPKTQARPTTVGLQIGMVNHLKKIPKMTFVERVIDIPDQGGEITMRFDADPARWDWMDHEPLKSTELSAADRGEIVKRVEELKQAIVDGDRDRVEESLRHKRNNFELQFGRDPRGIKILDDYWQTVLREPELISESVGNLNLEVGSRLVRVLAAEGGPILETRGVDPEDKNSPRVKIKKLYMAHYPEGWAICWSGNSF